VNRTYSPDEKAEAIAMRDLIGPRATERRLGIPCGTLVGWDAPTAMRYCRSRPYSLDALVAAIGLCPNDPELTGKLAAAVGLDRRWVRRCRRIGLTAEGADRWATAVGLHPSWVWPSWATDVESPEGEPGWFRDDAA
jgi:hypothetical protein